MISIVVAMGQNREIGKDNKLLWSLPNDMKHFKELTTGETVLMGRNTYDSIGKPLPNRRNFVVTSKELSTDFNSYGDIVKIPTDHVGNIIRMWRNNLPHHIELFVIGGASIYKQFLPYATRMYVTLVDGEFEADTFFPSFDMEEWNVSSYRIGHRDENHKYRQVYAILDKHKIK